MREASVAKSRCQEQKIMVRLKLGALRTLREESGAEAIPSEDFLFAGPKVSASSQLLEPQVDFHVGARVERA